MKVVLYLNLGLGESIEAMNRHCAMHGKEHETDFAEAFVQLRGHPYPQFDIFSETSGGK